ncbi:MAG: hemopexin repeat-containing protein [Nitrospira sp.]|nr:hemopexin repeat-containing protein [Nitrospira sp.]
MQSLIVILIWVGVIAIPSVYAGDTLKEYAQKCDEAIGLSVEDFSCDSGTEVPDTHPSSIPVKYGLTEKCDRPNHLNKECDPGSRFQVLKQTAEGFVVAHCRKRGQAQNNGKYKDVAVIQHNVRNGATCFYQALGEDLDGTKVKSPSQENAGQPGVPAWPWLPPAESAKIGCGACHDNGPIVRSPYMSQVAGAGGSRLLPGAMEPYTFNSSGDPYYFVGSDFASWKAYQVEIDGNHCNDCHRMGVSNVPVHGALGGHGTARDFGIRATAKDQGLAVKNSLGSDSPMWMVPNDPDNSPLDKFSQAHADAAKAMKDCADRFSVNSALPNERLCRITRFASAWKFSAVRWLGNTAYFFKGGRSIQYDVKADKVGGGDPQLVDSELPGLGGGPIDAAVVWGNGKAYLFRGDHYFRYDTTTKKVDGGYPRPIVPNWKGLWPDGVDAAVPWNDGKVYFFKGTDYIQYDVKSDKADAGFPKPIKDGWPEVAAKFPDGVDAALLWDTGKAYFFKGEQYLRYDVKARKVDTGYPKPIKGNWPGIAGLKW